MNRVSYLTAAVTVLCCTAVLNLSGRDRAEGNTKSPRDTVALFHETREVSDVLDAENLSVIRSRAVKIDFRRLAERKSQRDQAIDVSLFEDISVGFVVERAEARSDESYTLSGRVAGEGDSSFTLVVENDVMVANIRMPERGYYQIRYLGNGVHVIREIDDSQYPPCGGGLEPVGEARDAREPSGEAMDMLADDGSEVDVLVAYTAAARAGAGGTDGMNGLINLIISESNTAYARSEIISRLRLVGREEVAYNERSSMLSMLSDLRNGVGGLSVVHILRDAYCADVVALITESGDYCGVAYLMTSVILPPAASAFSVTKRSCAAGNMTFVHELGHNMGCHHDRENACSEASCSSVCCPGDLAKEQERGAYDYSYGYRIPTEWRTVMSYGDGCTFCPRIPHFSNPDVSYLGDPTGVMGGHPVGANNVLTINNTRTIVANRRTTCLASGACCNGTFCTEQVENTCVGGGGVYLGDVTACGPDSCLCGNGGLDAGEECDDGNSAGGDGCDKTCAIESCYQCQGEPSVCAAAGPLAGCREPIISQKALLLLKKQPNDSRDKLSWKWVNGAKTDFVDFGNPLTTDGYALCVYEGSGGLPDLLLSADAPAGGQCAERDCWRQLGSIGFKYKDKERTPDGLDKILMKSGDDRRAKIILKGKGVNLRLPSPLDVQLPLTVQLQSDNGECWEAKYFSVGVRRNEPALFKAKAGSPSGTFLDEINGLLD